MLVANGQVPQFLVMFYNKIRNVHEQSKKEILISNKKSFLSKTSHRIINGYQDMSRKPIMQFTQCNKIEDGKGVINNNIASHQMASN